MAGIRHAPCVLIMSALSGFFDASAQATTIHVPADAPTIQAGVNLAAPGDTVEVACGTYTAGAVLNGGIVVRSETGLPGCVTIDVVAGTEAFRATNLSQGVVIFGFRMTAPPGDARGMVVSGSNVTVRDCEFAGFSSESLFGMGLSMDDASNLTLDRSLFEDNSGLLGGGIYSTSSALTMTDCVMRRNRAFEGGALALEFSEATILNCDFIENEAISPKEESTPAGGAISNRDATAALTISDCMFENNSAEYGGCISSSDASGREPTGITHSVFRGNDASNEGSVISDVYDNFSFGGLYSMDDCVFMENQMFVIAAQVQIRSSLFVHNLGECVRAQGSSTIENCTFAQTAASNGGVIHEASESLAIRNSIVAFSEGGIIPVTCTTKSVTVECCDFYGNGGGDWIDPKGSFCIASQENANGNLSADPLFCDTKLGDFTIQENSPCAPAYSGACGLIGALGVGCKPIHVEETTWGAIKALYR